MYQPGSWAWDSERKEAVQIVEELSLWDHKSLRVWSPRDNTVYLTKGELLPISQAEGDSKESLAYKATAARLAETLATGELMLAPLESKIDPLPHQFSALERALSSDKIRYLLADEVGLGKTIEAGLILRELKLRGLVRRTLVLAPKGLVTQWVQELEDRFSEPFQLIIPSDFSTNDSLSGIWNKFDQVVVPLDSVKPIDARSGWSQKEVERYNQARVESLVMAGWDLVIIDEAHKVAGSTDTVARHKLGRALAQATPYLLLLSATPHQGKTDAFHRLMALLDPEAFPNEKAIQGRLIAPYVIRTEKRKAIDIKGKPLFKPRNTKLVTIPWEEKHQQQRDLYEKVTEYVRLGYNQALKEKRYGLGFMLVLMQRLVASSTAAIREALQRRLEVIQQAPSFIAGDLEIDEEWWELGGQEQYEELFSRQLAAFADEREQVMKLLALARRCEAAGTDAKAEALLQWLYKLQLEEQDPELKCLIFTEFVATQQMLAEFLENRGFSVVCLNGSMSLEERLQAQAEFSKDTRIMISTDAGGEGLNLQFCHIVINFDLPWNPMRLEQRIGRVDRIGQKHPVRAINFLLEDSIEWRVQEVLTEKLEAIARDFGVDKMSDVLDSTEVAQDFENLYKKAILAPQKINADVQALDSQLRARLKEISAANRLFGYQKELDLRQAAQLAAHPAPFWLERMTVNYLLSHGGKVERKLAGCNLEWPDGLQMENISFHRKTAEENQLSYLSMEEPRIRRLLEQIPRHVPGQPICSVEIGGLNAEICGYWSLWCISFQGGSQNRRFFPLFKNEDGRLFPVTAERIWQQLLLEQTALSVVEQIKGPLALEIYQELEAVAKEQGESLFKQLRNEIQANLSQRRERGNTVFQIRKQTIEKIGLPAVRRYRLAKLEEERKAWQAELARCEQLLPELEAVIIMKVGGQRT